MNDIVHKGATPPKFPKVGDRWQSEDGFTSLYDGFGWGARNYLRWKESKEGTFIAEEVSVNTEALETVTVLGEISAKRYFELKLKGQDYEHLESIYYGYYDKVNKSFEEEYDNEKI